MSMMHRFHVQRRVIACSMDSLRQQRQTRRMACAIVSALGDKPDFMENERHLRSRRAVNATRYQEADLMQLYDRPSLDELDDQRRAWEAGALRKAVDRFPERYAEFSTISGLPIDRVYTPGEVADVDYARDLGLPGEYPYTRGVHATGHRGRLWTMRMFAGFGTAEETNQRFKYLLAQGQTGLSIAFDMPTLYGYDTDAPEAEGEFGLCGVACASLADMQVLLDGLPLDAVTTSMTINSPAALIWAMYIAAAEKRGVGRAKLGGTLQNDILKEYIAQKEFIFPPRPSMRLVTDTIEFASAPDAAVESDFGVGLSHSRGGIHRRHRNWPLRSPTASSMFTGRLSAGLTSTTFAPRISFFFNAHNDFFEEIAKYRAARRIWARELKRDLRRAKTLVRGCCAFIHRPPA
jgi:methylmalonyl-CoA mutase N-terminal domain/subunit